VTRISRRAVLGAGAVAALSGCSADDAPRSAEPLGARPPAQPVEVVLRCRDSWGARPPTGHGVPHVVERLTVHHSAVALSDNDQATAQLRSFQREHQASGFTDIAYHRLIDLEGHVYEGRDPDTVGETYTQYDPTGHFLVCLLGHFDDQPLEPVQVDAMAGVLAWASDHYGVGTDTIAGHHDYDPVTACPGRRISAVLEDGSLAARVDEMLARGTPALRRQCGADAH